MRVRDLMERIRLHEIALPEFQREYVWEVEQARQLLESLYHIYPTGSLLFWETTTPPATKQTGAAPQVSGQRQIILDGQQRLTALYLLTQGEPPPYYGLKEIEHDPRGLHFDLIGGTFRPSPSGGAYPPSCVRMAECFHGEPDLLGIAQAVTKMQQGEAVNRLVAQCANNLARLRGILDYDYPMQIVPVSATLDDAIGVFDRVNSSGTRLTPAELALAHISGKWPEARQIMKTLLDQLSEHHFHLSLDLLVRGLAGVLSNRTDFVELHHLQASALQVGWGKLAAALNQLIPSVLHEAGITSGGYLSSLEILIPPAVSLARNVGTFPNNQARHRAIYWLYAANMWGRYAAEPDQRLAYDLSIVRRNADPWEELANAIAEQRGRVKLNPGDLEGCGPEHPLFRMVLITLAAEGATDWDTGVSLSGMPRLRSHPLFALAGLVGGPDEQVRRRQVDEIANQILLVSEPATPLHYRLPALAQQQPQLLEQHCIPADPALWQTSQLDAFLRARRELIAAAINTRLDSFYAASVSAQPPTLDDLRRAGESVSLEYKSTLRWDVEKGGKNESLEQVVIKTITAFLNTEGGHLLIGVQDDGSIYGIEHDLATTTDGDIDWFERHLRGLISKNIGMEYNRYVHPQFITADERTVCVVRVDRSPQPVFYRHQKDSNTAPSAVLYIRTGNASYMLPAVDLSLYIRNHWQH